MINNVKIGADPELFLENKEEIISAEGLIGGTKKNPKKISDEGHAVQEDNVMVEFNIPPSTTKKDFVKNINHCKKYIETLCKLYGDLKINYDCVHQLKDKYLDTFQAKQFSCDRDFNVYTEEPNPIVQTNGNTRSAGGHLHFGYDNPDQEKSEKIVLIADMILGLPSLFLDKDDKRREMYGQAGAFRFKDYGVEYRVLSNFWIKNNDLMEWAYESSIHCIDIINSGIDKELIKKYSKITSNVINNNDKKTAKKLIDSINNFIEEKENINNKKIKV